jgi:NADPH:quinone reductase-like Zn-dependent oxidoreductase
MMKAILHKRYGSPKHMYLGEAHKPEPQAGEVLIKVHAGSVTVGDSIMRKLPGIVALVFQIVAGAPRKVIPGHEVAGVIEALGEGVTSYKVGDAVFGSTTGLKTGANAEYVCVPVESKGNMLALKPKNVNFGEAAAIPIGAAAALQIMRKADIQPGQSVAIYGASGSLGSYAVQLAKHWGAEVTAISSQSNHDWLLELGADQVFDYHETDFATQAGQHDVVFAAINKLKKRDRAALLKEGGTYLSAFTPTKEENEDLEIIRELVEAGKLRAFIDKRYPLAETPAAHAYVDAGHKRGNVVIEIIPDAV